MEEDLNEEFEDYNFESDNPVVKFLFLFLEYVKDNHPDVYDEASNHAGDEVGLAIEDFEIVHLDEDDDFKNTPGVLDIEKDAEFPSFDINDYKVEDDSPEWLNNNDDEDDTK